MNGKDYYEILGVPRDADQNAIRDAFRNLALHHRPDRDKSSGAEERFKESAEACAVLSDPKKRSEYDNKGFISGFSSEDLFSGIDF
ncbi:MAG TPA: DnaJ domain-containing protein, partial [Burkholderiales bacterium]|nr:DnaJ domain-containing protein [Burkholderiales bacterium]